MKTKQNKRIAIYFLLACLASCGPQPEDKKETHLMADASAVEQVRVNDAFWAPKLQTWRTTTINDVFDKFEGKYEPVGSHLVADFEKKGTTRDAFRNFDMVAEGKRGTGLHFGPPWYDGLVYETIRAAGDFLSQYEDPVLEARVDGYIERIAAAQATEADGYINTYTQLMEPEHRWGLDGGMLRWQHDVYNAGMLAEAGVHYYKGTGKTRLLEVAVKFLNHMSDIMGPAPRKNIIPAHAGPEEAVIKVYHLFQDNPGLKDSLEVAVEEDRYKDLVTFWIEARGDHSGMPLWNEWGNQKAEAWIRDSIGSLKKYGNHSRVTWGDYAQDSIPLLEQTTIEGHAVRATLLATGLTALAMVNRDPEYRETATDLWENMVGKRMFVTGGVGAIADDEKFGPDYFLPNDSYLETCAAVGAGFFSQKMNALTGKGMYMDEFERALYNNVLTGISLSGTDYTYENPLVSDEHHRWHWHDCPCCPPMFLKMMSAFPDFIYSAENDTLRVNLFVGSEARVRLNGGTQVQIAQHTEYPWKGSVSIRLTPAEPSEFTLKVRVPGWARGTENPFGLYRSENPAALGITVNGVPIDTQPKDGYIGIQRKWTQGDEVEISLPVLPRLVTANEQVGDLEGMAVVAAGPLIYGFEAAMNPELSGISLMPDARPEMSFDPGLLGGVNTIEVKGQEIGKGRQVNLTAIPYYALGNLKEGGAYKVWLPVTDQ